MFCQREGVIRAGGLPNCRPRQCRPRQCRPGQCRPGQCRPGRCGCLENRPRARRLVPAALRVGIPCQAGPARPGPDRGHSATRDRAGRCVSRGRTNRGVATRYDGSAGLRPNPARHDPAGDGQGRCDSEIYRSLSCVGWAGLPNTALVALIGRVVPPGWCLWSAIGPGFNRICDPLAIESHIRTDGLNLIGCCSGRPSESSETRQKNDMLWRLSLGPESKENRRQPAGEAMLRVLRSSANSRTGS